jgi:V/A-type H+-transporting ATPase subunit I
VMFSTKNVYRFAALVQKRDAERTLEAILALGLLHPKKAEITFKGPFAPRAAKRFLPYEKMLRELAAKLEAAGVSCSGKVKVEDGDGFIASVINESSAIEKRAGEGKASPDDLLRLRAACEILDFKKEIMDFSKYTENADGFVVIEGWMDKARLPDARRAVGGPSALFEYVEPEGDAPTLLKNPWPFSLFEYVSRLYPPFRYGAIDITPVISVTFPIIFGLMFASVTDGVILLAVAAYLWWKNRGDTPQLLAILAFSAIFFGLLFGESGFLGTPAIVPVYSNPILLIMICIGVGFIHITIGHLLGILNRLAEGREREALAHVGFILLMLSAVAFLAWPQAALAGIAASALMIISGGARPISEIPHALGHLFSYARIFAISISHYSISTVFDSLAGKFPWTDVWGVLISLAILAAGHFILVTIELLIALIHTLRLHVLEFGTKFMASGVDWFKPYKRINKYVEM